jgi:hypothetical protein
MTETAVIQQKRIAIGEVEIDAFQLPDGSYRIGLGQMAEMLDMSFSVLLKSLQTQAAQASEHQKLEKAILERVVVDAPQDSYEQQEIWTITPEGLVIFLQWQLAQGNSKVLPFLKDLIARSINQYLATALQEPTAAVNSPNPVWQAYQASKQERQALYRRLADA